jgi:prophage regulatory protein
MATMQLESRRKRLIRLPMVLARVGYSRSRIYELIKAEKFPRPVKLGPRASAWVEEDIDAWINSRVAASLGRSDAGC